MTEKSCRKGDRQHVIDQRPEKIPADVPDHRPAQFDRFRNGAGIALRQNHIRRPDCNIRARSDGDPDIRPGEGRGIIDPVSHHGGQFMLFVAVGQPPDHFLFPGGEDFCDHFPDPCRGGDRLCRLCIISGQHDRMDPHVMQFFHRRSTAGADGVAERDHTGKSALFQEEQGRSAAGCILFQ